MALCIVSFGFTELEKRETCAATGRTGNVGRKRMEEFLSIYNCIRMLQSGICESGGVEPRRGKFYLFNFVKSCRPGAGRRDLDIIFEFAIYSFIHLMAFIVSHIGSSESLGITYLYQTSWV